MNEKNTLLQQVHALQLEMEGLKHDNRVNAEQLRIQTEELESLTKLRDTLIAELNAEKIKNIGKIICDVFILIASLTTDIRNIMRFMIFIKQIFHLLFSLISYSTNSG